MDLELSSKTALVTGGSRGIGKAIAKRLVAEGAAVALIARDEASLASAAEDVREAGGATVIALTGDTGSDASVREFVTEAVRQLGGLDIVVNAAATPASPGGAPRLEKIDEDVLWPEINVKVLGYIRVIREAVPHMRARGGGRVINISGLAARATGSTVGSIRNIAVAAMTKTLADELAGDRISVVAVHPALTVTERMPVVLEAAARRLGVSTQEAETRLAEDVLLGRLVSAEEVASVVAFLASPKAVAINGDAIPVGGGVRGPIYY